MHELHAFWKRGIVQSLWNITWMMYILKTHCLIPLKYLHSLIWNMSVLLRTQCNNFYLKIHKNRRDFSVFGKRCSIWKQRIHIVNKKMEVFFSLMWIHYECQLENHLIVYQDLSTPVTALNTDMTNHHTPDDLSKTVYCCTVMNIHIWTHQQKCVLLVSREEPCLSIYFLEVSNNPSSTALYL